MKLTWKQKAGIGASAGFCLALVTAVKAGFWLQDYTSDQIALGVLTISAFALISVIYTPFLEEDKPLKLFLQALVAPSFLLAVGTQGPASRTYDDSKKSPFDIIQSAEEVDSIPLLSVGDPVPNGWARPLAELVVVSALAQVGEPHSRPPHAAPIPASKGEEIVGPSVDENNNIEIKSLLLTREGIGDTSLEGALAVFGRRPPTRRFVYTLGRTTDEKLAIEFANRFKKLDPFKTDVIRVVRPQGRKEYYITLGELSTVQSAMFCKAVADVKAKAILDRHADDTDVEARRLAALVLKGKVVDTRALLRGSVLKKGKGNGNKGQ